MCMGIIKDCKNLEESYGQICVLCNKCGRFDKKILTKDQRIAELEKENEEKEDKILDLKSYNSDLKETISKLSFSAVRCQAINDEVCQYILDNELLQQENEQLKQQLAEKNKLLENPIVPKFKVGDKVWYIFTKKQEKPYSSIIRGFEIDTKKGILNYYTDIFILNESRYNLFSTEQEAEEALKKLNKE